jgi:ketosteroid isomerase-like protein
MGKELRRRRNIELTVSGSLIEAVDALESVDQQAGLAWWSCTGDLDVDGAYHREASWTVVLRRWGEEDDSEWRIVHSHFSIHR